MGVIYRSTNLYPQNIYIDGTVNNNFYGTVNGAKVTDYQLRIYNLSNSLIYDSTKITLSSPLPNGSVLTHTVPMGSITNGSQYKWTLQTWNALDSAITREILFSAYTAPVITFNPPVTITAQDYEFTATYTQSEGVGLSYYKFILYDENGEIIEETQNIYDFDIKHTFEGLVNGTEYGIRLTGQFQLNGMSFDTGISQFMAVYTEPDFSMTPSTEFDSNTSFVDIQWGQVVQIIGDYPVGSETYVNNFIRTGNTGLGMDSGEYVNFDVDIPIDFTLKFIWQPDSNSFTGKIIELDDGVYEVGYDGSKFTYTINGVSQSTLPIDIFGSVFYLVLLPTKIRVKRLQLFELWNNYLGMTWQDILDNGTWEDILLI